MRRAGCRGTGALAVLLVAACLFGTIGCGDDESLGPITDQTPGDWKRLFAGQANDPAYGPTGTPAEHLLAFSSLRTSAAGDSLGGFEHLWILDLSDSTFHQITAGGNSDYAPAWSAGGNRICFTRYDGSRRDIYWLDATDLANPGAPIRVTDRPIASSGATEGAWITLGGQEYIVFSDGKNILRVPPTGGSPVKVVPDPSDFRPSDCGGVEFEDLQAVPDPRTGRVAFVSRGRTVVSTLTVRGRDGSGAPTVARFWLQGCDTLVIEDSVAVFADLPEGGYRVRAYKPGLGLCDTLDVSIARPDTSLEFTFQTGSGDVLVRSISDNGSEFPYLVDCENTLIQSTPVVISAPRDSLIYTRLKCLSPGLHMISGTQGVTLDTVWVNVVSGAEVQVTMTLLDSAFVDTVLAGTGLFHYPHGGLGSFYQERCVDSACVDSICVDSICVEPGPGGECLRWECTEWQCTRRICAIVTRDWVRADTLCAGGGGGDGRAPSWGGSFPILRSSKRTGQSLLDEAIWIYDPGTDTFMSGPGGGAGQRPVWDPTGRNRLAAVVQNRGYWGVAILDLDLATSTLVALPGQDGPFICRRDAVGLSWSPDGGRLAVAVGPCNGGDYPRELEIWTVDLTSLSLR